VLNRVESTEYSQATNVYTQMYFITLSMLGIGQMSRLVVYL